MSEIRLRTLGRHARAFLEGFLEGPPRRDVPNGNGGSEPDPPSERKPFPRAGIDGFLSHFVFTIRLNRGEQAGELFSYTWPVAVQTVARTDPFIYRRGEARARFSLAKGSRLPTTLSEEEFLATPPDFFEEGKETIFLQILNLDAKGETPYGAMRCILGETFKREYPDIFQPSFGAAQSLSGRGLPGKIFFVPNGIFETPFGALHTRPKALLGSHITSIPPIGSSPSLLEPIPLDSVEELRRRGVRSLAEGDPSEATLIALAHPLDAEVYESGGDLFQSVERSIERK